MPSTNVESLMMALLEYPDDIQDLVYILSDALEDEGNRHSTMVREVAKKFPELWACPECGSSLGAMNGGYPLPSTFRHGQRKGEGMMDIPIERTLLACTGSYGPIGTRSRLVLGDVRPGFRRRCGRVILKTEAKLAARELAVSTLINKIMGWK